MTGKEIGGVKGTIRIALLALAAGMAVLAAEPGHTAYRPHDLLGRIHVHALINDIDRFAAV